MALVVAETPGLGNPQIDLADARLEGLRLESVGVTLTIGTLRDSALRACSRSIFVSRFMSVANTSAIAAGPKSISSAWRSANADPIPSWWVIAGFPFLVS
jgi:hypothetical protein